MAAAIASLAAAGLWAGLAWLSLPREAVVETVDDAAFAAAWIDRVRGGV